MRTIHKYGLDVVPDDIQSIDMPEHARVLTVQVQLGDVQLWVSVNPDAERWETRAFKLAPTGGVARVDDDWVYVGTVQMSNGHLVWHVFEVIA